MIILFFLFISFTQLLDLRAQTHQAFGDINSRTIAVDTQSAEDPFDKPSASDTDESGTNGTDSNKASQKIKLKTYGFVKNNIFWDSRQVFAFRENDVLFWPLKYMPDVSGRDINAHPAFHILPIETLVGIALTGPKIADGVRASALIEGDFVGLVEILTNQFRMRHAYLELEFERSRSTLLTGQYWHPLFVLDCFAETISFNFGTPFDIASRQPQIRFTKRGEHAQIMLTALTERDFQSFGPDLECPKEFLAIPDTRFKRNAAFPDLDLQLKFFYHRHVFGGNIDFKRIVARIVTDKNVKVTEFNNSFVAQLFSRIQFEHGAIRMKCIFEQNGPPSLTPGGYAIRTIDPITDKRTYSNLNWVTCWLDTSWLVTKPNLEPGLFLGFAKNFGSFDRLYINPETQKPIIYGIGEDIAYLWRISPRLIVNRLPFRFGIELEITTAAFGCPDEFARVHNACPITNARLMLSTYYVF